MEEPPLAPAGDRGLSLRGAEPRGGWHSPAPRATRGPAPRLAAKGQLFVASTKTRDSRPRRRGGALPPTAPPHPRAPPRPAFTHVRGRAAASFAVAGPREPPPAGPGPGARGAPAGRGGPSHGAAAGPDRAGGGGGGAGPRPPLMHAEAGGGAGRC